MFDTETLVPLGLFVSLAVVLIGLAKILSDGRTRRRLIEAGVTAEVVRAVTPAVRDDLGVYSALKWGAVIVAAGLALVVIQFLPYREDAPIVPGILLVFVGAALLIYWAFVRRHQPGAHPSDRNSP
jgi:hypothetical protein